MDCELPVTAAVPLPVWSARRSVAFLETEDKDVRGGGGGPSDHNDPSSGGTIAWMQEARPDVRCQCIMKSSSTFYKISVRGQ